MAKLLGAGGGQEVVERRMGGGREKDWDGAVNEDDYQNGR